ncbi:MAG: DMT family transporter, partial [Planctomycetota bacterium]
LAMIAIVTMAIGIVMAKPIIQEMAVIWSTIIRLAAGMFFLALFALLGKNRKTYWAVYLPSASWKFALPGSILGSYAAMIFWIAGFKYTYASIAAVLNQMSVIFAIILAVIFLKESFSGRKYAAVVLAVMGVVLVSLENWIAEIWQHNPIGVIGPVAIILLLATGAYYAIRALLPAKPLAVGFPVAVEGQPIAGSGDLVEGDTLPEELHP